MFRYVTTWVQYSWTYWNLQLKKKKNRQNEEEEEKENGEAHFGEIFWSKPLVKNGAH